MRVVLGIAAGFCFIYLSGFAHASDIIARHGLSLSKYEKELSKWSQRGYHPSVIDGYRVNGKLYFATIWRKAAGKKWRARHGLSAEDYHSENRQMSSQGYRLKHLSGYEEKGQSRYAAVWFKEKGASVQAHLDLTPAAFETEQKAWRRKGYRLVHVKGYSVGKEAKHIAIWIKQKSASDFIARLALMPDQYKQQNKIWGAKGYQLSQLSGYSSDGKVRYNAVWQKQKNQVPVIRRDMSSINYQSEIDNRHYSGYRLKKVSGYAIGKRAFYSASWENGAMTRADAGRIDKAISGFMKKHSMPGLSIAIARKGKLVFAKGYGFSRVKPAWVTSPMHKFRIGSISRSVTSLAIMKLVEQGKIKLNDKVFGAKAALGKKFGKAPYSKVVQAITIEHLLKKGAGEKEEIIKRGAPQDDQVIAEALKGLASKKGAADVSDMSARFRFAVLGAIIESKSGMPYGRFVRKHVLAPAGIRKMALGRMSKSRRRANEVVYYGRDGSDPYSIAISRAKVEMGWIASPIDLVRLMVHTDGHSSRKDILSAASLNKITTGALTAKKNPGGWFSKKGDGRSYSGTLSGSKVVLARSSGEFS